MNGTERKALVETLLEEVATRTEQRPADAALHFSQAAYFVIRFADRAYGGNFYSHDTCFDPLSKRHLHQEFQQRAKEKGYIV